MSTRRRSWARLRVQPNATALVEELQSLVDDVLDRFPKLEETLKSSLVSEEQKEQLLTRIFGGKASPEVLNFLKVLVATRPLGHPAKRIAAGDQAPRDTSAA